MGNQIILTSDPSGISGPFLSGEMKQMCLNATEFLATQQAFKDVAYQLGCIMLLIGFSIGLFAGYYYCKGKYGSSE